MTEENYPTFIKRVNATVIDTVIIVFLLIVIKYMLINFFNVQDNASMIAIITVFILYEPILTSVFGGTIGHKIFGLQVKRENNQQKNILFPMAIIRFIFKVVLGSISSLTVSGNSKGMAIHDSIVGSIVVYKK